VKEIQQIAENAENDLIASSYVSWAVRVSCSYLTQGQSTEFDIDREYVSRIVGTGGAGANKLRTSLGVKIEFADETDERDPNPNPKRKGKPLSQKTHVTVNVASIIHITFLTDMVL
jgi:predicted PilT family ATPase